MNVRALLCLALIHTLVDGCAQFIAPLWPQLQEDLDLSPGGLTFVFAAWQTASSVSQPLFGYLGDRFGSRWSVAIGPALAITCLSLIGLASTPAALAGLLVLGGLGIGAFHPEAAAVVADAAGGKAARGLSLFIFGGMVGLGLGPIVSGGVVERWGLPSLAWVMLPGLLALGVLLVLKPPAHHTARPHEPAAGLAEIFHGRHLAATVLLTVSTMRAVSVLGIPFAVAFWMKQQGASPRDIGLVQGVFLLSGSLGTLLCPLLARPGKELAEMVLTIVPAAGCILLLNFPNPVVQFVGLAGSGLLLQGAVPLLIAYAQRLLPRGRRLAASLILGTSWGLAGLIVAGLQAYFNAIGRPEAVLWALAPFTLLAGLGSLLLPRRDEPAAELPKSQEVIDVRENQEVGRFAS